MSRIFLSQIILRMELYLEGKVIFYLSNVVILLCNRNKRRLHTGSNGNNFKVSLYEGKDVPSNSQYLWGDQ